MILPISGWLDEIMDREPESELAIDEAAKVL